MDKCKRCNIQADSAKIKKCPIKNSTWFNTKICYNCYKEIKSGQDEIKNSIIKKEKPIDLAGKKSCDYCGSPVEKHREFCPHCMFHFNDKKVNKRKKEVILEPKKKVSREENDYNFPKPESEIIKSIPKKYRYIPLISLIVVIIIGSVYAFQAGIVDDMINGTTEQAVIGKWVLQDMPGPADDMFRQTWTFYEKNQSLIIITDYDSRNTDDRVNHLLWDLNKDCLKIDIPYSEQNQDLIFNVKAVSYDFEYKDGKITLTNDKDILKTVMNLAKTKN